jgi:hypothetical protein
MILQETSNPLAKVEGQVVAAEGQQASVEMPEAGGAEMSRFSKS